MLDGAEQGRLSPGEKVTVTTTAGSHEIFVTTDGRVRSRSSKVDLSPGERAQVLAGSPRSPFANLFRIFYRPADTLEIERSTRRRPSR